MENQIKAQIESNKIILIIIGVIAVLAIGLYLFDLKNSQGSNVNTQPNVTVVPVSFAEELSSRKWTWLNTKMSDSSVVNPSKAGAFTASFQKDLNLLVTTDCNSGRGSYVAGSDNSVAISQIATTMMYCEGSNETLFYRNLGNVGSYKISNGQLWLMLKFDSGTMIFE